MNEIKVFFKKDPFNLIIFVLSIIILLIGIFVVNFWIGLLVFILVNLIWVIPFIEWHKKLEDRKGLKQNLLRI